MPGNKTLTALFITIIGVVLLLPPDAHSADNEKEYRLKAAFIFNFSKFISWPESDKSNFTICINGPENTYQIFKDVLTGKKHNNREISIAQIDSTEQLAECSILFSASHSTITPQQSPGLLTIGESDEYIQQGGLIRFYSQTGKLRFEINQQSATEAGLNISSKLLRLAKIVEPENNAGRDAK